MRRLLTLPDGQRFDVELRVEDRGIRALAYPRQQAGVFSEDAVAETEGADFDEAEKQLYDLLMKQYY